VFFIKGGEGEKEFVRSGAVVKNCHERWSSDVPNPNK